MEFKKEPVNGWVVSGWVVEGEVRQDDMQSLTIHFSKPPKGGIPVRAVVGCPTEVGPDIGHDGEVFISLFEGN